MLENDIVIITHADHFVGPRASQIFAGYGATVICHGGKTEAGITTAVSKEPEDLIDEVISKFGRIDALISNDAYPAVRIPIDEPSPQEMRNALEALVEWPYRLISRTVPHMKRHGGGKIVMVTSAPEVLSP